jgi:hypothetical protein
MNRVATKIAQEVRMLLENQHLDTGAGQQQSEHHTCRTSSCNTALH